MVSPDEGGPRGTLSQLKSDSAASGAELREFFSEFKGKDPREVMGVIANSGLARSIFLATLACAAILAAGTAGPYFLGWGNAAEATQQTKKSQQPVLPEPQQQAAKSATNATKKGLAERAKQNKKEAAKKMGLTEAKQADPNENPLDDKLKNLLEGKK